MDVIKPSKLVLESYLNKWDSLENYVFQESSLRKLFSVTYPLNNNMDDVLIKVCSLNDFYSTNIYSPFTVAKHIVGLDIDFRLQRNDLNIVNEIAIVKMKDGKVRNFYSFATKYCSHHKPEIYPIFDNYVEKLLLHFKKTDHFCDFAKNDLKQYAKYHHVLIEFKQFYGLNDFNLKQIDKYLWQAGKEYFRRKY